MTMDIDIMYRLMLSAYMTAKRDKALTDNTYAMGMIEMYILATGSDKIFLLKQLETDAQLNAAIL